MGDKNTSVPENENTAENSVNESKPDVDSKEQKASNASNARRRIREREARKANPVTFESGLEAEDDEMISNSRVGKMTESLMGKVDEMEGRLDADEVAQEVKKFVNNHDYKEYIDENAIVAKALDPKYADLEYEDLVWLSLKDKMPEIYAKKQRESEKKIEETALPKSNGGLDKSIKDMSMEDWRKDREKIIAGLRTNS